jgi:DNA-binding transcriptional regulator LsrR (DeoR family)
MSKETRVERVARRYWLDGATMDAIATEESVSRSTISRLLDRARATGIVTISVNPMHGRAQAMARVLEDRHGVTAHVVPTPDGAGDLARLQIVAEETGRVLDDAMGSDMTVGVAWGTTLSAISKHLLARPLRGAQVVQLNGLMNTHSSGVGYGSDVLGRFGTAWDAQVHHFPVPAFFDHPETRQAMWRERSVQRVLRFQQIADIAVFGVGAVAGAVPSRVYTDAYLTASDRVDLASHRVVGDVCTVFLRADGSWEGIPLNARTSGLPPPALRHIPRRICAVTGANKVRGLAAALAAGLVTDLVVDERTAQNLLALRVTAATPPTRQVAVR